MEAVVVLVAAAEDADEEVLFDDVDVDVEGDDDDSITHPFSSAQGHEE